MTEIRAAHIIGCYAFAALLIVAAGSFAIGFLVAS
jgi:hypothetical protein